MVIVLSAVTLAPVPLIRGWTTSLVGGSVFGTVICGSRPAVTVGSPLAGVTALPSGPDSGRMMSTTKTKVSPTSMPACGLPPPPS